MAVSLLALLIIDVLLFVATDLLMPRPKLQGVSPNFPDRPTSKEGSVIPVIFGTVLIPANVTHFSNVTAEEQKEKVKTGIFSSHSVTVGYSYSAIMQVILCHGPVNELVDIVWQDILGLNDTNEITIQENVGGKFSLRTEMIDYTSPSLPWPIQPAEPFGTEFVVFADELFGGYKHGGGVQGFLRMHWGLPDQLADPSLENLVGAPYPAYAGLAYVVLGRTEGAGAPTPFNFGEFGTVPPLAFVVRRCPSGLGLSSAFTNLNGGANPAECIYEVLTNTVWGLFVPPSEINLATFIAAATTLESEQFGINLALNDQSSGDDVLTELLRYIDGNLQQNPTTGLLELSLNRADYVVADLLHLDDSNSSAVVTRPAWSALINQVKVTYTGKRGAKYTQVTTQPVDDIASQREFGVVHSITIPFLGIQDALLANRLAVRELRKGATPLKRARVKVNRIAAGLMVGSPFKLSSAAAGVNGHVFRVVSVDYGTRLQGEITIDAIEDVFNLDSPFYNTPLDPPDSWIGVGPVGPVKVDINTITDPDTGYLTLTLVGGGGLATAVQFQEQSGGGALSAWHDNVTPDEFKTQVDLDERNPSLIGWRVLGHLKSGAIGTLAEGEANFPVATRPARPALTYKMNTDGSIDLTLDFDQDSSTYKVKVSYLDVPTTVEVQATAAQPVPGSRRAVLPGVAVLDSINTVAYAAAIAIDAIGRESLLGTVTIGIKSDSDRVALRIIRARAVNDSLVEVEAYVADSAPNPHAALTVRASGQGIAGVSSEDGTQLAVLTARGNMVLKPRTLLDDAWGATEPKQSNKVPNQKIAGPTWSGNGTYTDNFATFDGIAFTRVQGDGTTNYRFINVPLTGNGVKVFAIKVHHRGFVGDDVMLLFDTVANAVRAGLKITYGAAGALTAVVFGAGTIIHQETRPEGTLDVYVLSVACTAANAHNIYVSDVTGALPPGTGVHDCLVGDIRVYDVEPGLSLDQTRLNPDGTRGVAVLTVLPGQPNNILSQQIALADFNGQQLSLEVWLKSEDAVPANVHVSVLDQTSAPVSPDIVNGAVVVTNQWRKVTMSGIVTHVTSSMTISIQLDAPARRTLQIWSPTVVKGFIAAVTNDLDTTDFVKFTVTKAERQRTARNIILESDTLNTSPWQVAFGATVAENSVVINGVTYNKISGANVGSVTQILDVEDAGIHCFSIKLRYVPGFALGKIRVGLLNETDSLNEVFAEVQINPDGSLTSLGVTFGTGTVLSLTPLGDNAYQLVVRTGTLNPVKTYRAYACSVHTATTYYATRVQLTAGADPFPVDIPTTAVKQSNTVDNASGMLQLTATKNGGSPVSQTITIEPSGSLGEAVPLIAIEGEATSRDGKGQGVVRLLIKMEPKTNLIEVYGSRSPAIGGAQAEVNERSYCGTVERQEGIISSDDQWETEFDIPTDAPWFRQVATLTYGGRTLKQFSRLPVLRLLEAQAIDVGVGPVAKPTGLTVTPTIVSGLPRNTIEWVNADPLAQARVWRDGIVLKRMKLGDTKLVDDNLIPKKKYVYRVQGIRNGQTTDFADGDGISVTDGSTLSTPSWVPGYPTGGTSQIRDDESGNPQYVNIMVNNPSSAALTEVWMSADSSGGGPFTKVTTIEAGGVGATLYAASFGLPAGSTRAFYLVATRAGFDPSPESEHRSATFAADS